MKLKSTVAVLGTAAFLHLVSISAVLAGPAVDSSKNTTGQTLENAARKLSYVAAQTPSNGAGDEASTTTTQPTSPDKESQAPAGGSRQPIDPAQAAKPTATAVQMADNDDVITLNMLAKAKQDVPLAVQKRFRALKKRSNGPGTNRSNTPKREDILRRRMARIAYAALSYRGTPYVWGGSSPRAFDCSGFTQYLYKTQYDINLPHNARMQFQKGTPVGLDQARSGDLVFFNTKGPLTHVGMYLGDGKFVHAANPRRGVRVDGLTGYYQRCFAGARSYR